MNDITKASANAVGALGGLASNLANLQASMPATVSDPYLRLLTDGEWVYGSSDTPVEDGTLWAISPQSLQHGLVSWTNNPPEMKKANEIVGEVMVDAGSPLPDVSTLPVSDTPYKKQYACVMVCVAGKNKGDQVLYKSTSMGGVRAFEGLVSSIVKQLSADPANPVPVVELGVDSYKHKSYGKTYVPDIKIDSWAALDATEIEEADEEEEEEEAPRARTRRRA